LTKEVLNKPNELISIISDKNISSTQRKAYNTFLKFAQNKIKFENHKGNLFQIHYIDLYNKSNIKNKNMDYVEEKEIDNLMRTVVKIRDKENKKNWKAFTLLSYVERKEDYFYFELNNFIITALKEQTFFTTIDLIAVNSLSSHYSAIFYELAIRYKKKKIPKMSIEEIREITNTQNKYKAIKDFKIYVLDKACEEISEKTDIILSYETEKRGKRIAYIDFIIEEKENVEDLEEVEYFKDIEEIKESNYSEEVLNLYKVLPIEDQLETRKKQLEKLLKEHSYEMLEADIKYCKKNSKKNFWGYFVKSINSGHYSTIELEKEKAKEELVKKQKILEEHKKELKKQEEIFLKEQAKEMFENISENEFNNYKEEYKNQEKMLKKFGVNLETFIISNLKNKLKMNQ